MVKKKFLTVFLLVAFLLGIFLLTSGTARAACIAEAPMNLSATNVNGQVHLNWMHGGLNLSKFALVYGSSTNDYRHGITMIPKETRTFHVQHLIPGFTYFYRVWSFCENEGPATHSSETSVLTPGGSIGGAATMAPDTTAMKTTPTATPTPKK